jgi:A/G-specific adenine glycosylase
MPWRETRDPYRIWVSEIMLQQTQVATAIPYYTRFVARFPDVRSLARARTDDVLAAWAGLGYYRRARHLHAAARLVVREHGARVPSDSEAFARLPGVGRYTTGAVLSIAFDQPLPVLDGNVTRVLSRWFARRARAKDPRSERRLWALAESLVPMRHPGDWNQALMELGATVCLPRNPQCLLCPWRDDCKARALGIQAELPVKRRKREAVKLQVELLVLQKEGRLLLRQRGGGEARLAGFWELPQAEDLRTADRGELLGTFRHTITRHDYTVEVWRAAAVKAPKGYRWFSLAEVAALPLATMARKALDLAGL